MDVLDERKKEGRPEKTTQDCGVSSVKTAEVVGISPRKVEQVRTVLDHATPEIKQAVESGAKTINAAYNETQQQRKEQAQAEPEIGAF